MDLLQFDTKKASEEGAKLTLKDPFTRAPIKDKDENTIVITCLGKHSAAYIATQNRLSNRRLKEARGRGPTSTVEEMEAETIELLASAIIGWSDNLEMSGMAFPFSPENAFALLSNNKLRWIREQIDEFVGDIGNFMQLSS